jgi:pimeloyl-ACP methyl ester carboxylesterase
MINVDQIKHDRATYARLKDFAFVFINGIRTPLTDRAYSDPQAAWNLRAEAWCEERGIHNHTYRYYTPAVTRFLHQAQFAEIAKEKIDDCYQPRTVLVGHSNGADICIRAAKLCKAKIDQLVLIAGAADERFDANGLNDLLLEQKVRRVSVWWSASDDTLLGARTWTSWLRPFGLGYGWLGLVGPKRVSPLVKHRVLTRVYTGFRHSTYFTEQQFPLTMRHIMTDAAESVEGRESRVESQRRIA